MLLIPALFLGILELALRVAGFGYSTNFWVPSTIDGEEYLVPNTQFTYRFFPPALARAPLPMRMLAEKPEGTYRIFLFGESAAYGDPDPAYGMGRQLEILLRERFPGTEFEVICTAMTAINSHAILPLARESAKLDGDLWIIYMGNNEMVGAYGAGTVFSSKAPPLGVVRGILFLKSTRIGQLMDTLLSGGSNDSMDRDDWDGINMFTRTSLRYNDPSRLTAYKNFRGNLEDILKIGKKADVPVLLSTVASNLKDCAPFISLNDKSLGTSRLSQWEQFYALGRQSESAQAYGEALSYYSQAAEIDPNYAELQYRMGQSFLAMGNAESALEAFESARDHDGLAVRADTRINLIIQNAAKNAEGKVSLLDSAKELSAESSGIIPGKEHFYEHVHLTLNGNYALARAMAERITGMLPSVILDTDSGDWVSLETCNRELAATLWDQHRLWNNMLKRGSVPPHTAQSNHRANLEYLTQQAQKVIAQITNKTPQEDRALYLEAITKYPNDNLIHARFGQYLEAMGSRNEAIAQFQKVCELLPDVEWPHFYLAELFFRAGRKDEARQSLSRALEIRPDFAQALNKLSEI
ncbi:tetratricopeptide repeat protein [Oceanipulchritudo coccoides]|nr:tetratricopeptide repeat protein [Oceanipulchritudo coccoides]